MIQRLLSTLLALALMAYAGTAQALFLSPDPMDPTLLGVGTNRYAYSFGDPVNNMDPGGNACIPCAPAAYAAWPYVTAGAGIMGLWIADQLDWSDPGITPIDPSLIPNTTGTQVGDGAGFGNEWIVESYPVADSAPTIEGLPVAEDIGGSIVWTPVAQPYSDNIVYSEGFDPNNPDPNLGVVYLRVDPRTGQAYIGRANSPGLYGRRQSAHDRRLDTAHDYDILGQALPGTDLRVLEESFIRSHGGPSVQGGTLANGRYEMNDPAYTGAGGSVVKPNAPPPPPKW